MGEENKDEWRKGRRVGKGKGKGICKDTWREGIVYKKRPYIRKI